MVKGFSILGLDKITDAVDAAKQKGKLRFVLIAAMAFVVFLFLRKRRG